MAKHKKTFFLLVCGSLIFIVLSPFSHARYILGNQPGKAVAKISSQAGRFFLEGVSSIYFSVGALEDRNSSKANYILETQVTGFLNKSLQLYYQIEKQLPGRNVNLEKFSKGQLGSFKKDLKYLNFDLPGTDKELNRISIDTVISFSTFIKEVKFTDNEKHNADSMRRINEQIYKIMKLSISLAEIAAAIE